MKQVTIELIDGYFIEVDELNHTLKQRYTGEDKEGNPKEGCVRTMNEQLKPCPFCGCHDRKVSIRRMGNKGYSVVCGNCGGKGPYITIKDWHDNKMIAQGQAIASWNRRAE